MCPVRQTASGPGRRFVCWRHLTRVGYLLLLAMLVASTQIAQAQTGSRTQWSQVSGGRALDPPTVNPAVPTVDVPSDPPAAIPTVSLPKPTPKPTRAHAKKKKPAKTVRSGPVRSQNETWIWAYLTSYCPGSAGWISSSGMPVYYGMLANNYYPFGTRVYMPVLGIVGVVEDHVGDYTWNHFDVWSPVCYGTPTGWFKVAIEG